HGPGDAEQVLGPVGDRTGQVVPAGDAALLFLKGFLADLSPAGITRPVSSGAAPPQEMVGTGHATAPSSPVISSVIRPSTLPTARGTSDSAILGSAAAGSCAVPTTDCAVSTACA